MFYFQVLTRSATVTAVAAVAEALRRPFLFQLFESLLTMFLAPAHLAARVDGTRNELPPQCGGRVVFRRVFFDRFA